MAQAPAALKNRKPPWPAIDVLLAGKNLLVVDDDALIREAVFARLARRARLSLWTAATLCDGEAQLAVREYAVVFVDLHLDGTDGVHLIRAAVKQTPRPMVVAVSGTTDLREVSRAWRAGCDDFIHKPFGPAEFDAVLQRAAGAPVVGETRLPESLARYAAEHATAAGRAMLEARYGGESNADIAARLGVHRDTVKRRLREEFLRPLASRRVMHLERAARAWFAIADADET